MQQAYFLTYFFRKQSFMSVSTFHTFFLILRICCCVHVCVGGQADGRMGVCVVCFLIHTEGSMRKWLCVFTVDHQQ